MSASRDRWDKRYGAATAVWSRGPNARLVEEVEALPPGRALDAGCGEGRNALWLASRGWVVTGIDFSTVAIDKARARSTAEGLEVDWQVADLAEATLDQAAYDLVIALYLHTSPAERERWLRALAAATAPGGTFLYLGHDPRNIEAGRGGPQDPAVLPDAATIAGALVGFDVERAIVVERAVDDDPGHGRPGPGVALDTLVRARKR